MSPLSTAQRKIEIARTATTTTIVKLVTSSLVGQVTFFNSSLASRTKAIIPRIESSILFTGDLCLGFFVIRMLIAELAILLHLKLAGLVLLIFCDGIIPPLAFLACQQYDLAHIPFLGFLTICYKKLQLPCSQPINIIGITPSGVGNSELSRPRPHEPTTRIELVTFCLPCKCSTD